MTIKRVGFIGIGNMGSAMAAQLIRKGFDVTVFDIRPETVSMFVEQHGGTAAQSVDELARGVDAVITMLPNDKIVHTVIMGVNGAAYTLPPGGVVIDMSTSDPVATRKLAGELKPMGIEMLDAPVMGGVVFARDATLDIMVGGDEALLKRCKPLFEAMGRSVMPCGGIGNGHAMKALANYVNATALINVLEAMTIGRKFGLDSKFMAAALMPMCVVRNHPLEKKIIPQVLTGKYATGMTLGFIAKDVKIAADTAESIGAFAPLAQRVSELWNQAAEKVGAGADQTEIVKFWEQATGVSLN